MNLLKGKATKIAVIQSNIIANNKEQNLKNALVMMDDAVSNKADVICLPEAFATGISFPSIRKVAEEVDSSIIFSTITDFCIKNSVYVIFGMIEKVSNLYYDSAFIIDKNGKLCASYKRHSLLAEESLYFSSGDVGKVIETDFGRVGLLLGYDIRFPHSAINYFNSEVDLIVSMNNTFREYAYPINTISQARALDNLCVFVNVNSVGMHDLANDSYYGISSITDGTYSDLSNPGKHVIAIAQNKQEIIYGDIYFKSIVKKHKGDSSRYYDDYLKWWTGP